MMMFAKIHRIVFHHLIFHKPSLMAISTLMSVVGMVFPVLIASAFSWVSAIAMGQNGYYTVLFDPSLRARPNDGIAYVVGEGGNGGQSLLVTTSTNPALDLNINNAPDTTGSMRNQLGFAQDGTGYFVWRHHPAGYQAWLRKMNPDGSFVTTTTDLGTLYKNAGGTKEPDLPDVAVSTLTNKVYVTGQVVTSLSTLGFAEYDPVTNTVINPVNNLPANNGGEMKPRICVDNSQGRDDIHIVGWFGYDLYGVDRINGVWAVSPALTSSAAAQFQFGQSLAIACASNGYAYAAYDSINADNTGYSTGLVRYTPGSGWAQVNRNPGHTFGGYDIYGLSYSRSWLCSIPGVGGSGVAVTPDNKVWVSSGVRCGSYTGQIVASFSNNGNTLDTFDGALPYTATSKKAQIDYGLVTSQMYIASQYQSPSPNVTYLSYTTLIVPPTNFTATTISFKQINLNWNYPYPANLTNVQLERSTDNINWSVLAQLPISQLSYSDNTLASPGTTYYYRLKGYNTSLSSTYVTAADTTVGPASLVFDIAPGQIEPAPTTFGIAPKLSIRDPFNNIITNHTGNFTLAVSTGPSGASFGRTKTIAKINGVADYSSAGLTLDKLGSYQLSASAPNIPSGTLSATVTAVVTSKLVFTTSPSPDPLANAQFSATVQVQRPSNNTVLNTYNGTITLAIQSNSGVPGAKLNSGNFITGNVVNGVATFTNNLSIDLYGGNYQLIATSSTDPLTPGLSNTFNVLATPLFSNPPTNPTIPIANNSFSVVVTVQDAASNTLTTYNGPVTLSSSNGTLLGIATISAVNGVATFNNLAFSTNGTYSLQANLPLGNAATSNSISVSSATGCQPLLVTLTGSTGDDGCNNVTLAGALSRVASQEVIRFAPSVVPSLINLGSGPLTLPGGASIQGGCSSSGPQVTISVSGNSAFQPGPNSTIWGIKITGPVNGLQLLIPSTNKGNSFSCFKIGP